MTMRASLRRLVDPAIKAGGACLAIVYYIGLHVGMATVYDKALAYLNTLAWFTTPLFTVHGFTIDPSFSAKLLYYGLNSAIQFAGILHVFGILHG